MARITVEDCTRQVGNRFRLVLMAAIRSRQLMRGARPLVQAEENREAVISLREIASGKVQPDSDEDS
ncbi:MAG: DNA-directed RNA polymerase subunit omega [Myxococcales bacterium]|nr:DNA-directed RNA polymerase subunit omega [Myxococcales bacterium]